MAVVQPIPASNGHHLGNGNGAPPTASIRQSSSSHSNLSAGGIKPSMSNSSSLAAALVNRPSLIEYKHLRFLIMDAPTENNLYAYIDVLKKKQVVAVVRACEPTYQVDALTRAGIKVVEAPFADGDPPPEHILNEWLGLVNRVFAENTKTTDKPTQKPVGTTTANGTVSAAGDASDGSDKKTIAVHCVAGLGRAPVMVAIALIEAGMSNLDVIDFIRKRRRGAFNSKQLKYIQGYKPKNGGKKGDCCIM